MNRILLFAGSLLNLSLALFKIAMPYLFHWREEMGSSAASMWAILYGENLGISLLLLFFAYMSIFQWQELISAGLGKMVMLSISMVSIHSYASEDKRIWSRLGLAFTLTYATMAAINYMVQLLPVWRSIINDETDGFAMFVLGNPHSIFWGLAYAYIFMNLDFALLDFVLIIPGALGSLLTGFWICRTAEKVGLQGA